MAQPKIRARYLTKSLGKQKVAFKKCSIDPETKSLQMEDTVEEHECFMVMFPQGHSIRVVGRDKLVELGYDKKPRMVDMDTGDVIDIGGEAYDFADDLNVAVMDEDEDEAKPARSKTAKEPA